jgi:microcystin degradation protein MlrC
MRPRVLIAGFKHETNTFSTLPTDLAAYRARKLFEGDEVAARLAGTRSEIAAFLDARDRHAWDVVHPIYADATPSGRVTREAFEYVSERIVACLQHQGPFDAVLLALHGAMVAEHHDDGEGALLARVREHVGTQVPVAVTLDLHANVTDRMARLADIMVSYRTYPHVDQYEIATEAADLLARTLAGELHPRCTVARGAMLDGADHGRTTAPGPMLEVLAHAERLRAQQPGVLSISINAGFPWADMHDAGPSAIMVHDSGLDRERAHALAQALIDDIWASRHRSTVDTVTCEHALGTLTGAPGAPVVLADFADNPGGGGYGDATRLLGALCRAGLQRAAFATVYDPPAARACHAAGLGAELSLALGGKVDPRYGEPLPVTGSVHALADGRFDLEGPMMAGTPVHMGASAVLRVAGVDIVLASARYQAYDRMFFRHLGIEPGACSVLGVKSAHHFRAAFAPIASRIEVVDDGGGLTSRNFAQLRYRNLRRPVYPLDLE